MLLLCCQCSQVHCAPSPWLPIGAPTERCFRLKGRQLEADHRQQIIAFVCVTFRERIRSITQGELCKALFRADNIGYIYFELKAKRINRRLL
ncbi:hypothetical protein CDAR_309651 [Caerostris darwini]|uniref:Secreted protein n=1 Tax=Caerostris darwini TaxID=1538125 RepID=A0AAV4VX90_9ARAC|nr:hypothetical protein CDAR_309651 [Caerostris darwini]